MTSEAESHLVAQFRMTYTEASEALANASLTAAESCTNDATDVSSIASRIARRRPWQADSCIGSSSFLRQPQHLAAATTSLQGFESRESTCSPSQEKEAQQHSPRNSFSLPPKNGQQHGNVVRRKYATTKLSVVPEEPANPITDEYGSLHSDNANADATETTADTTDYTETSSSSGISVMEQLSDEDHIFVSGSYQRKMVGKSRRPAAARMHGKTSKKNIASRKSSATTTVTSSADRFSYSALCTTLMHEYDGLTYTEARSIIQKTRSKFGDRMVLNGDFEKHCRSMIQLTQGQEDFRNVILKSIHASNCPSQRQHLRTTERPNSGTVRWSHCSGTNANNSLSTEALVMQRYSIGYIPAKRLAAATRQELGLKPWDSFQRAPFLETSDRLWSERPRANDDCSTPCKSTANTKSIVREAKHMLMKQHASSRPSSHSSATPVIRPHPHTSQLEIDEQQASFASTSSECKDSRKLMLGTSVTDKCPATTIDVIDDDDSVGSNDAFDFAVDYLGDIVETSCARQSVVEATEKLVCNEDSLEPSVAQTTVEVAVAPEDHVQPTLPAKDVDSDIAQNEAYGLLNIQKCRLEALLEVTSGRCTPTDDLGMRSAVNKEITKEVVLDPDPIVEIQEVAKENCIADVDSEQTYSATPAGKETLQLLDLSTSSIDCGEESCPVRCANNDRVYPPMPPTSLAGSQATVRPLEVLLVHRHGISWNGASHVVKMGRRSLGMTESEAWTPQLEEFCEQELKETSSSPEDAMAQSLTDTKSIVVSITAGSQRCIDADAVVGKDWVELTLDECSQVSRCPSQTNNFVIVEDSSCTGESSQSATNGAVSVSSSVSIVDQLPVPPVIYVDRQNPPEVLPDEPLEARVGLPFIAATSKSHKNANRKSTKSRRSRNQFLNRLRRSIRRFRRKAMGLHPKQLHEDDTECRVQTLLSF